MISIENNPITCPSLNELVSDLSEGERTTFNKIFRTMEVPISTFEEYCSWSDKSYTRNCIYDDDKFELILLCWNEGQGTPIHDHGGEECWVKIVEGEFRETIYNSNEKGEFKALKSTLANTNDITYMIDFMGFHKLENLSNKRSMSLHLYAKPIRSCNMFDETSKTFVSKDLCYNTTV